MTDIAARLGISKATVSLALRNVSRIPLATRQRIQATAARLGYRRNPVVAHLMAELRKTVPAGYQRTLALLNAHHDVHACTRHPTISVWMEGCHAQAQACGYRLDEFWLGDPRLNGERLDRILTARNIRGAIIMGFFGQNQLPALYAPIWEKYACVVAGVRTHAPTLSFASVDHHELVIDAVEHARRLGYQRPALVLERRIDELVNGRFGCAMWKALQALPAGQRIPTHYQAADRALFTTWFHRHQPDVILTLHPILRDWLQLMNLKTPDDVGLIHLELDSRSKGWAGMSQHNNVAGRALIDLLISMEHHNEFGIPEFPRATLIGSTWINGSTVRDLTTATRPAPAPRPKPRAQPRSARSRS